MKRLVVCGLALGALVMAAQNIPDLIRYLRIRSM
jgi:hypothetical protein